MCAVRVAMNVDDPFSRTGVLLDLDCARVDCGVKRSNDASTNQAVAT